MAYGKEITSWKKIANLAKKSNLEVILEISTTANNKVDEAIQVAIEMNVKNIRLYPRESGKVSEIIPKITNDLKYATSHPLVKEHNLVFHLEQHEDLKATELVNIVKQVNSTNLKLLYDSTNMTTAFEHPLESLRKQLPFVEFAHLCDAKIIKTDNEPNNGCSMLGTTTGTGDIPLERIILELLLSNNEVKAFAMEEQVGIKAPPYRYPAQELDSFIPPREISETPVDINMIDEIKSKEINDAVAQIATIRGTLNRIKYFAIRKIFSNKYDVIF